MEDQNHLFMCQDIATTENCTRFRELGTLMKDLETALEKQIMVVGIMKFVWHGNNSTCNIFIIIFP